MPESNVQHRSQSTAWKSRTFQVHQWTHFDFTLNTVHCVQVAWQNGGYPGNAGKIQGRGGFSWNFGRGEFSVRCHFSMNNPQLMIAFTEFSTDWGANDSHRKSCSGQSAQAAWQTRHGKTAGEQSIHKMSIFNPFLTICRPGCRDTVHLGDVHLLSPSRLLKSDPIYSVNISEYCIFLQEI